jgi:dipicolinate synthase subunit A
LAGADVAVVGYGRIGKHLCRLASAWGARVTVAARRGRNCNLAQSQGFAVKDPSEQGLFSDAELIFNTVPVPILCEKSFLPHRKDALYVELASSPGGIDPTCTPPIPVIAAQGLPGKYCPQSAGRALAEAVMLHLEVEKW